MTTGSTPTRAAFLAAYRRELEREPGYSENIPDLVTALRAAILDEPGGFLWPITCGNRPVIQRAWRSIGGTGAVTLVGVRGLGE